MKPTLIAGDCRYVLRAFPSNSWDSCVTDPPYGLSKHPNMAEVLKHWLAGDDYTATGGGFMGKTWDSFVPGPATWSEVLRVMKPGAYAAVFAGSRTQDLMATALRLAGFEVLDTLFWMYGQGFPKSMGVEVAGEKWGTALKPAYEPIILCRKPLDGTYANNIMEHGCGALNIDGSRNGERWPANILHDGCLPEPMDRYFYCAKATKADRDDGLAHWPDRTAGQATDRKDGSKGLENPRSGAGRTGGSKNPHVTVKPTELMRWLCKLITPPGGRIGDPFCGSGSTGRGAKLGGFEFTGIDLDPVNIKVSQDRIDIIES